MKVPTIRYYEQIGLLPKTARKGNNRRFYGAVDVRRLVFIRRARELGQAEAEILLKKLNPEFSDEPAVR